MRRFQGLGAVLVGCLLVVWFMTQNPQAVLNTDETVSAASAQPAASGRWWRGQVHIHTNLTPPDGVVRWYKAQGYNFVVITDLNYATQIDGLKSVHDQAGRFLILPGTELSVEPGNKIIDSQGYGGNHIKIVEEYLDDLKKRGIKVELPKVIQLPETMKAEDLLNDQARFIRKHGGIPAPTHPNLAWSFNHEHLLKTDPKLVRHLEIRTGEPGMNDMGGGGRPSVEQMWDHVLSTGRVMWGVAGDDSHHFDQWGTYSFFAASGVFQRQAPANPGRTSVYVWASELTAKAIMEAFDNGQFYSVQHFSSLPIELSSYEADRTGIRITLPQVVKDIGWSKPGANITQYRTEFIGKDGKVLKVDESLTPSYRFQGNELYVRARIRDSDGGWAWTQPFFRGR